MIYSRLLVLCLSGEVQVERIRVLVQMWVCVSVGSMCVSRCCAQWYDVDRRKRPPNILGAFPPPSTSLSFPLSHQGNPIPPKSQEYSYICGQRKKPSAPPMFFQQEPPADRYLLRITAGPSYDPSTHVTVPVNKPETVKFTSSRADVELNVRIKGYRGLPPDCPSTSGYFYRGTHVEDGDQYSICFRFTPRRPVSEDLGAYDSEGVDGEVHSESGSEIEVDNEAGIRGGDLQFGNDFDKPIRDYLPPGFNTALNIVKWWIDPGLDGDAYSDTPHLFGPALSSFNTVHCGPGTYDPSAGLVFSEGGDGEGSRMREEAGIPKEPKERVKWALSKGNKEKWLWEYGRTYGFDFFNPYIDFERFKVQLPGFKMGVLRYWDGQSLRCVLRTPSTLLICLDCFDFPLLRSMGLRSTDTCSGISARKMST